MRHEYKTRGTCSQKIAFVLNNGIVTNVSFLGGCHGNLQGIARLCEGKQADEIITSLRGIRCGFKPTSCPDQLAKALLRAKEQ